MPWWFAVGSTVLSRTSRETRSTRMPLALARSNISSRRFSLTPSATRILSIRRALARRASSTGRTPNIVACVVDRSGVFAGGRPVSAGGRRVSAKGLRLSCRGLVSLNFFFIKPPLEPRVFRHLQSVVRRQNIRDLVSPEAERDGISPRFAGPRIFKNRAHLGVIVDNPNG